MAKKSIITLALGSALSGVTICSHAACVWAMDVNLAIGRARRCSCGPSCKGHQNDL